MERKKEIKKVRKRERVTDSEENYFIIIKILFEESVNDSKSLISSKIRIYKVKTSTHI